MMLLRFTIYGVFIFLSAYCAGNMLTLHVQHYGIYPHIRKDGFREYMQANNQAALIPSVVPGTLLLALSILMLFYRPGFMPFTSALTSLLLNLIAFASTAGWQRRLQSEMAETGYSEEKIALLRSTNWVRVVAFFLLAILAVYIGVHALWVATIHQTVGAAIR